MPSRRTTATRSREQRLLAEGAGLVDRSDRDVVAVPGADRLTWLHSLTSQHLERLGDASGSEALVLSPNGHVEHHLVLADLGGTTWADVEPGTGAALVDFLQKMRFMLRVDPALVTDAWAVLSLVGPNGPEILTAAGLPAPERAVRSARSGPGLRPPHARDRRRHARPCSTSSSRAGRSRPSPTGWARRSPASPRSRRCGSRPGGRASAWTATTARSRTSCQWLQTAVHLDKGCYRGQETVARVHNLGRPPRRLVLLHLDGVSEVLAEPGTPVLAGTREVGRVGSVVRHYELGVIALALVKQSVAMDAALTVAGSTASIDPDDAPEAPDDTLTAARERVRAVRSATIGR